MSVCCPHCRKSLGGTNNQGEFRVRLGIVLCDPDDGRVHGPCPNCKGDVTVATGAALSKALTESSDLRPGLRLPGLTPSSRKQ